MEPDIEELLGESSAEAVASEAKKKTGRKPKAAKPEPTGFALTDEEMSRLEAEAQAEVQEELRANLADEYKKNYKAQLKREALFRKGKDEEGEDLVDVLIDLPSFCPDIRLDGVIYTNGETYKMGRAKAASVKDIIARAYKHQDELDGVDANEAAYRQKRRDRVSAA